MIELVRQCWCDYCAGALKKKVSATEAVATVHDGKRWVQFDGCEEHNDPRIGEVFEYGYHVDGPAHPVKSVKSAKGTPGGAREQLQCLTCGKTVSSGSGSALHANMHTRRGEPKPEFKAV